DQIMKRSHAVIAVSESMKQSIIESNVNQDLIHVVVNFLTSTSIACSEAKSAERVKLLFVGRLSPEKGCHILIRAMKLLPQDEFNLTIVGEGIERIALEKLAQD